METKLHKDDVRTRRRIMHHITRQVNKTGGGTNAEFSYKRAQWEGMKDLVHEAITQVLADERRSSE